MSPYHKGINRMYTNADEIIDRIDDSLGYIMNDEDLKHIRELLSSLRSARDIDTNGFSPDIQHALENGYVTSATWSADYDASESIFLDLEIIVDSWPEDING